MTPSKKIWIAVTITAIIAILGLFSPVGKSVSFGGITNYDEVDATAIKIGGANGSRIGPIIDGTCALLANAATSVAATTTAVADCAVTGVVPGDNVVAQFSTSTVSSPVWGATSANWTIVAAKASTTAGYITVVVRNETGGTASLSASGIASSTQYHISHPVSTVPGL